MSRAAGWLAGERRCEHGFQLYVVEMENRCTACDGPICPLRVVIVRDRRVTLCPDCEE